MQVKQILRRMFTRVYPFAIFFSTNENSCFKIADRCCQQRENNHPLTLFSQFFLKSFFKNLTRLMSNVNNLLLLKFANLQRKGREEGGEKKFISHPLKSILQRWFPTYYHSVRVYARSYRTRSSN